MYIQGATGRKKREAIMAAEEEHRNQQIELQSRHKRQTLSGKINIDCVPFKHTSKHKCVILFLIQNTFDVDVDFDVAVIIPNDCYFHVYRMCR